MLDGPRSRPAPPPPPPAKPAAPANAAKPQGATAPDTYRATQAKPVDKGQAAAKQAVTVNEHDVRGQRDEVRVEGRKQVEQTRTDLQNRAGEIRSHQGDKNYRVEIEKRDDKTIYRESYVGKDSSITRQTYLEVSKDHPPKATLDETRKDGDRWVQEHQHVEGGGDKFKTDSYEINFKDYPGAPQKMNDFGGGSVGYDPHRQSQKVTSFEADGGDVSKKEQSIHFDKTGRVDGTRDASAEFKESKGKDVDLPGGIDNAFDDGKPVIESNIKIARTDKDGKEHVTANEHHWSQGPVRVSEKSGEGKGTTLLLEKQAADGKSKDAQLFIKGKQETVTIHTELNKNGSVTETQKLWDSNDGVVGDPKDHRPDLKQSTSTTTSYGDDGRVAKQHKTTFDKDSGERRVEDFKRTVSGKVAHYETRQEIIPKDGKRQVTTIDEQSRITPKGEEPFQTVIKGQGHTVKITEDDKGRHYADTNDKTGKTVHGNVKKAGGGIELEINGKKLQLDADGSFKDKDKLKALKPEEFSAVPFLTTGAGGVKGLVGSLGKDPVEAEQNVVEALNDAGGVDKFKAAGAFFGTAASAKAVLDDIRNGDVLQAALDGGKTGVAGTQLAGSLLGKFEAASKLGKALGAAGGALEVASGVYGVFKADNNYDKATSGLNIVQGGMGIALALTAASGPAAPFLFAGIVGVEVAKGIIGHSKAQYVAPVQAELR